MAPAASEYSTKELTKETLPDFERLFEKRPGPGAFGCWCLYHHRTRPSAVSKGRSSKVERAARNRQQKRELVEKGGSHGILVYSEGEPVGWCQYGSNEELPRFDDRRGFPRSASNDDTKKFWRITCFVVDGKHRRRGVASAALKAALAAIKSKGGGIVEAYPILHWGSYREYLGTASMFQEEGFKIVEPFGKNNVVMRKKI